MTGEVQHEGSFLIGGNVTAQGFNNDTGTNLSRAAYCPGSVLDYGASYETLRYAIDVYLVPVIIVVGLAGNALAFAVLSDMKASVSGRVLQALAVADSLYLVGAFFFQTLKTLHVYDDGFALAARVFFPYCEAHVVWPLANTAQTTAVWLVLLVTAERCWAVCRPLHSRRLLTGRRNRLWMAGLTVSAVLFNLPTHFELRVVRFPSHQDCPGLRQLEARATRLITGYYYNLLYKTIASFLFRSVGPIVALVALNGVLLRAVKTARVESVTQQTTSRHSRQMTRLVVVLVSVFVFCQLPDIAFRIIRTIKIYNPLFPFEWKTMAYLATVTNLFLTINSASNFILYCLSGGEFRKLVAKRMRRTRRRFLVNRYESNGSSVFMLT